MKKSAIVLASLIGLTATACGGGGGSSSTAFAEELSDTCQALGKDLAKLDAPGDLATTQTFATEAADLYDKVVVTLKKLSPPADSKQAFEELRDNMAAQIDALDDIAKSAKAGDQDKTDDAIAEFNKLADDNAELASDAGARRCAIDSAFTGVVAPPDDTTPADTIPDDTTDSTTGDSTDDTTDVTTGDTTEVSTPPTLPPVTTDTTPTTGSVEAGEKVFEDLPPQMGASADGYVFGTVEQQFIDNFLKFLTRTEAMNNAGGVYGAVEILKDTQPFARVFAFVPQPAMNDGDIRELVDDLASGQPVTVEMISQIQGLRFTSTDNYEFFVAGDEVNGMFMFVTADNESMDVAVPAFFESIAA